MFSKTCPALLLSALFFLSCGEKKPTDAPTEDLTAKQELQGVWVNDETEDVAFRIKGDSLFFPDSTSAVQTFKVVSDTFVVTGANTSRYAIVKRTAHLFQFLNPSGEVVRLVKSTDAAYEKMFQKRAAPVNINQGKLIKTDTVVYRDNNKYHCYVQVNPTSYKVLRASYNDDGVEVDNAYYDNIVHLAIYNGNQKIISRDFRKDDFKKLVPETILRQSVFSDIVFSDTAPDGIHYFAILAVPGSSTSFMVELIISYEGKLHQRIKEGVTVH